MGYKKLQGFPRGCREIRRVTRGYRGLQGVTGDYKGLQTGYKGLQRVTGGYKGLQRVTRGHRGLQGVTGGYKGLQWVTRGYRELQAVTGVSERKNEHELSHENPTTILTRNPTRNPYLAIWYSFCNNFVVLRKGGLAGLFACLTLVTTFWSFIHSTK